MADATAGLLGPRPEQDTGFGWSDLGVGLLGLKFPAFATSYYAQKAAQNQYAQSQYDSKQIWGTPNQHYDQAGQQRLQGFGVAPQAAGATDANGMPLPTPNYMSAEEARNAIQTPSTGRFSRLKEGSPEYNAALTNQGLYATGRDSNMNSALANLASNQANSVKPYSPHYFTQGVPGQDDRTQNAMLNKDGSVTTFGETQKKGSTGVTINNGQGQDGVQWMTDEEKIRLDHRPEDKVYYHRTTGAPTLYDPKAPTARLEAQSKANYTSALFENVKKALYTEDGKLRVDPRSMAYGAQSLIKDMPGSGFVTSQAFQKMEQAYSVASEDYLRIVTGAAISKEEAAKAQQDYGPKWGDSADIIAQKLDGLKLFGQRLREKAGLPPLEEPEVSADDYSKMSDKQWAAYKLSQTKAANGG